MDERDRTILQKILKDIDFLISDTKGITLEKFLSDERLMRSTAMTILKIGELANHLTMDFKKSTKLPIKEMVAMRNYAAHEYDALRFDTVWKTVQKSLPDLKIQIEKEL